MSSTLRFETQRLLLRPYEEYDSGLTREQMTDPDVVKYLTGKIFDENELTERVNASLVRSLCGAISVWVLIDHETGEKLGTSILLPMPIEETKPTWQDLDLNSLDSEIKIEVGYILKKSAWGKGYATEACTRLLQFAFEKTKLKEVWAVTDDGNAASQRVLRKSGMKDVGITKAYNENLPTFKLTKKEWLTSKL